MCGIMGIVGDSKKQEPHVTDAMLGTLSKRGPDDMGVLTFPQCILGQTRLSIIDLSSGHQPMRDRKRAMAITFNGEIYNYRELKRDLEGKGYAFATNSDTEVILKSYQEYGTECPKYLDGMFAFAIWDEEKQRLFVARDRFGKKPFYYAHNTDGDLVFASEIKALLKAGVKGVIDWGAIDNYLTLMYIPPWKSVYSNIKVLAPAHCASFQNGIWRSWRYWNIPTSPISVSYADAKEQVKFLLKKSVEKRMIADVEIGSFLSGGVDSTIVTYLAQQSSSKPLKTFSVGYGDYINELPFAQEASAKIGTDHHTLQSDGHLLDEFKRVVAYMDEPHADSSNMSQYLVSKLAGSKVKVALSGDGADELFLGYGWHTQYQHQPKISRLKNIFFSDQLKEHIRYVSIFQRPEHREIWRDPSVTNDDIFPGGIFDLRNGFERVNYFDLTAYLPGQLLSKIDRMSMMNSLEVRSPFLDTELAEYAFNLPRVYKNDGREYKIILKDILAEIMPKRFVYRRKQGFGAPVHHWLLQPDMKDLVLKTLDNDTARIYEKMRPEYIRAKIAEFYATQDKKYSYHIWMFLCLELWLQGI